MRFLDRMKKEWVDQRMDQGSLKASLYAKLKVDARRTRGFARATELISRLYLNERFAKIASSQHRSKRVRGLRKAFDSIFLVENPAAMQMLTHLFKKLGLVTINKVTHKQWIHFQPVGFAKRRGLLEPSLTRCGNVLSIMGNHAAE